MISFKRTFILCIWIFLCGTAMGQHVRTATDTLTVTPGDTVRLSHTFLTPFSEVLKLNGDLLMDDVYHLDYVSGILILDNVMDTSVVTVNYRYFKEGPQSEIAIRKFEVLLDTLKDKEYVDVFFYPKEEVDNDLWEGDSRIRKSGSISRGLTVGNNQGLSVNSGLRLQLEGELGDGLKIVGAITDENIPIQPDGTTEQISDFDKIFIKLMKGPYGVTIGDFEIQQKGTYFTDLYRNVQGLQASVNSEKTKVSVSGAVAKGKFHTNQIVGVEGVSGPYRLTGRNGERFFTVLAGSEVVYLNGERQTRGQNNDYIIDYNTAEVYFMPSQVITSATRIVIDFEYTDRYYNRSLVFANVEQKLLKDKLKFKFSYGRDGDNANAPFDNDQAFSNARDTLSKIGDDLTQALTSGVTETDRFDESAFYVRQDTIIQGDLFERYVYNPASDSSIYRVTFTEVGMNNGFYVRSATSQNRNVFKWVGPDSLTGIPLGDFAPLRVWVLPKLLQVMGARLSYQISKNAHIYSESAASLEDKNRLSDLDDDDNLGVANRTGLKFNDIQLADSAIRLGVDVYHQYVSQRYVNLDRIYKAEYNRIWDIDDVNQRVDEQIVMGKTRLEFKDKLSLDTETGVRNTGPGRQSIRQVYRVSSTMPKFLQGNYSFTQIRTRDDSLFKASRWDRHNGDVFAHIGKFKPGVEIWLEDRQVERRDTFGDGTFSFIDLKPYFRTHETQKFRLDLSVNYRKEKEFKDGLKRDKSEAYTYFSQLNYKPSRFFDLRSTSSYRIFNVGDSVFRSVGLQDARVLNTNLQTTVQTKNRLFYTNFLYEVASERVAKKEIRFLEVNPGQGQYVWLDSLFNKDGQQQVDEFQLAVNPLNANFIRVLFPTQELFPTTKASFTGTIRFNFKNVLEKSKNPFKETARNFRSATNFRVSQSKTRNNRISGYLVDFVNVFDDTTLLDANYNLRQDFTFFQNNQVGDLRLSYLDTKSKLFLLTGNEFRGFRYYSASQRINIGRSKSIENETRWGNKFTLADAFSTRNYDIDFIEAKPKVNFQFSKKVRFSTGYEYAFRKNTNDSMRLDAKAYVHKVVTETKWNIKKLNTITSKLELISYHQEGETDFSADYELKNGLREGLNAIWQVFFTVYVMENVELSFTYDGRISQEIPILHSGRVQVKAFF